MPNIDESAKAWQKEMARRVGAAVQNLRRTRRWTALELAQKTRDLGYPISRVAISKIESNSRAGKLDLAELLVLSAALSTSPINLVYPGPYQDEIEVLPHRPVKQFHAAQWFSGIEWSLNVAFTYSDKRPDADGATGADKWRQATHALTARRQLDDLHSSRAAIMMRGEFDRDRDTIAMYDRMIRELEQQLGIDDDA